MDLLVKIPLMIALVFTGILCGASLDQSFKQLPARHKIGMTAFSAYAKAADLKNGVWWYALIGIGSALSTLITAVMTILKHDIPTTFSFTVYTAALCSIGQAVCTSKAAPTYFRQKSVTDEKALENIFNRFERIQTVRSAFIVLNFAALLWATSLLL